jgi:hypothetical protein
MKYSKTNGHTNKTNKKLRDQEKASELALSRRQQVAWLGARQSDIWS